MQVFPPPSQRLHHNRVLVSRLCCLTERCLPCRQHPFHLYASLQPHAVRWVQQTPAPCLGVSEKMHRHTCRDVGSVGSVAYIFVKKMHMCALYPLLALPEPCHSLCLLQQWSQRLRLSRWCAMFPFLPPFAPPCSHPVVQQSLPQSTRVASERTGVGRCRGGVALGVGAPHCWIGLSPHLILYRCRGVAGVGVLLPIFLCFHPGERSDQFSSARAGCEESVKPSVKGPLTLEPPPTSPRNICEGREGCEGVNSEQKSSETLFCFSCSAELFSSYPFFSNLASYG